MQTSQLRIDLPLEQQPILIKHLKKYSSTWLIGHETSKKSKKSHFHIHFQHKKHIDTVRRYFRKQYSELSQMGFYLKHIKTTNAKSMAYVIKDGNYTQSGITEEELTEATEIVKTYQQEENLRTLREKIIYRLNEHPDNKQWFVNTEVMLAILIIFKKKNLSYPSQSWIKQCIVSYWMQDPTRTLAIQNIEKIYNIQDPFVKESDLL